MKYKNLTLKEVKERQEKYGKNLLPEEKTASELKIFVLQFANPLVYILLFAGLVSVFLQKYFDILLILSVVVINALMGFFQEYKTQKTFTALKRLVKPEAKVFRDDKKQKISAFELVSGDIVFLGSGDRVPADGKILEVASFFVNEAILTGESEAVAKKKDDDVFMGTIVVSGRAVFEVTKIGLATKIGEIAKTLKETVQPITTLQLRLKKMTHTLILISVFLSLLVFAFGSFIGRNFWQMAELSAVLLVAIIPEALLIVLTLILVLAMRDSLKKKALIRKILAVETLGSVTTICIDKTGTLTEGMMKIAETHFTNEKNSLLAMCLCNDMNDTVEIALWEYLKKIKDFDAQEIYDAHERIFEISFGSEHKFMAVVNVFEEKGKSQYTLFVKGAPEVVVSMCNLPAGKRKLAEDQINKWAEKGLKVLGLASKKISKAEVDKISVGNISSLKWDGLVGLWDPPRKEVKETFLIAKKSGLQIKVVTGDYYKTAQKVMAHLGIEVAPDEILEGFQMDKMSDEQFNNEVSKVLLFARVSPQQKLRIVNVLQQKGEIVAMTGDGVNDAPALKKSNIGIVMGALLMNWPFPLSAAQILWLHFLCDGPEDFILGFEPKEKETMLEGPKKMGEPILDKLGIFLIITISLLSGILSLGFFWYFGLRQGNLMLGQTMSFMSLAFSSVVYIFSCRTLRKPFWRYENFWSNKWLFVVVFSSLFLAVAITYLPFTQKMLNIVPLQPLHWILLILKAILLVAIIEIAKYFIKIKPTRCQTQTAHTGAFLV